MTVRSAYTTPCAGPCLTFDRGLVDGTVEVSTEGGVGLLRSRDEVEELYRAVLAGLMLPPQEELLGTPWTVGVADALAWVLGRSEIAPATLDARLGWPSDDEVMAENQVTQAILAGRRDTADRPREWMIGVGYALTWAVDAPAQPSPRI